MSAFELVLVVVGVAVLVLACGGAVFVGANHARLWQYHRYKGTPPPVRGGAALRAYLLELGAFAALLAVRLLPARAGTHRVPAPHLTGRPVLFVHGFLGWAEDFTFLRRLLEQRGRPTYAVGLGPAFAPIESYSRVLAGHMIELLGRHRDAGGFDLVAHSMGGLAVRRTLAEHPELAARVCHLVTLGTPHQGTAAARGLVVGENVRQMKRRSRFAAELPPCEASCPSASVTTIAASVDAIVYPRDTTRLPGARHVELDGIGHAGLLVHRTALDAVLEALSDGEAA